MDVIKKATTETAVAKTNRTSMQGYIKKMEGEIKKALPSVITPERFTRIALSAISNNPKLADCTPESFLGAMMTSAQLGMEINTPLGMSYLIPRMNKKKGVMECQFELGYKGLIDLAYRSGQVSTISAHVVYQNDKFEYALGLEPKLVHVPAQSNRGDATYVYAVFKTKDGGYGFEVMSIDDVRKHANKFSESFNSSFSPWNTNFEEMAKKTVLKRALKYAPLKTEFARAMTADEGIHESIGEDMFSEPVSYVVDVDQNGEVIESEATNVK